MCDLSSRVSREALVKSLENLTGRKDVELLDNFQVNRASSAVEGFTSLVLRVKVSYRLPGDDEIYSYVFIVKSMPQTEFQQTFVKESRIFSRECLILREVVPLMTRVSAGRVDVPVPTCYHGICDSDDSALYMEDLVAIGYRGVNRSCFTDGLDYPHCSVVMKALGKFHALSVAAEKALEPGKGGWIGCFPELDRENVYYVTGPDDPPAPVKNMIDSMVQNLKEMCNEIDGFPKMAVASGALERVLQGVHPTISRLKETPPQSRRVLGHGDCWMNNMMFRYKKWEAEADEPTEVKFFDLQVTKCNHPGIDLLYFMYISTRRTLRDKYFSILIEEYYYSFTETLRVLDGCLPPFSLEDLRSELMGEYKPYGLIMGVLYMPLLMLGDDFLLPNAEDLTEEKMEELFNMGNTGKIKYRFHNDSKYRYHLEDIIREFLDMALPKGLESVESSPLLVKAVN